MFSKISFLVLMIGFVINALAYSQTQSHPDYTVRAEQSCPQPQELIKTFCYCTLNPHSGYENKFVLYRVDIVAGETPKDFTYPIEAFSDRGTCQWEMRKISFCAQ
jgi:hypothetical protein